MESKPRAMGTEPILCVSALLLGGVFWGADGNRIAQPGLEQLFLATAVLVFLQGLVRDLLVIAARRKAVGAAEPKDRSSIGAALWELNLCLESTVGVILLVTAIVFWFLPGAGTTIAVPRGLLAAGGGALLCAGWLTRDWVLTVRHVQDHYDLPVWRKR